MQMGASRVGLKGLDCSMEQGGGEFGGQGSVLRGETDCLVCGSCLVSRSVTYSHAPSRLARVG